MKKWINLTLGVATLLSLSLPLAAHADTTQTIMVGDTSTPNGSVASYNTDIDRNLLLNVSNPTGNAVNFVVPSLAINDTVPANGAKTFYIDGGQLTNRDTAFQVTDPQGNVISSGTLENMAIATSPSNDALASLINYSTDYQVSQKPEPRYYTERETAYHPTHPTKTVRKTTSSYRSNVRGYW